LINFYISYAPQDKAYLDAFLAKIRPMQEKYALRIWYNHPEPVPEIPFPWKILFFWYKPNPSNLPYHRDLHLEAEQAHIYLFFTSQHTLSIPWIEAEELRRATARYQDLGNRYIRIFPVLLSSSQWNVFSGLTSHPTLGPVGRTLNQLPNQEDGWDTMLEQLEPVIKELRRNHMEENKRLGLPVEPPPAPWNDTLQELVPFPKWIGWAMIVAILFSLTRFADKQCTRKLPPGRPHRDPSPEEYRRENPYQKPDEIVLPRDTSLNR
jgi:hypothetical protein